TAVAFSGGADSTLLLKGCREELGDGAVAVTSSSESMPASELDEARALAASMGARHVVVQTHEIEKEGDARKPADRCFHCKHELFETMTALARAEGLRTIAYGLITDDLREFRPGQRAAQEFAVRSPLAEAGFSKEDVRAASRSLGLKTWDKPSSP